MNNTHLICYIKLLTYTSIKCYINSIRTIVIQTIHTIPVYSLSYILNSLRNLKALSLQFLSLAAILSAMDISILCSRFLL